MSILESVCFTIRAIDRCRATRVAFRSPACASTGPLFSFRVRLDGRGKSPEGETIYHMEPQVGSILEGKVTSITKFGAFVALDSGQSGLVHISEIANSFVNDVHDFLQEGQTVKVLVLSTENGKINLSIKKALPPQERPVSRGPRPGTNGSPRSGMNGGPRPAGGASRPAQQQSRPAFAARQQPLPPSGDQSFEDKLKQFLTSSEGKMADLNRSIDGKRGGGRRRK